MSDPLVFDVTVAIASLYLKAMLAIHEDDDCCEATCVDAEVLRQLIALLARLPQDATLATALGEIHRVD